MIALCVFVLALGSTPFWDRVVDDAFITLTFGRQLFDGDGLTWPGVPGPVEGYTSVAWVVLMGLLDAVGADVPRATQLVAGACGAAWLAVLCWRSRHLPGGWLVGLAWGVWAPLQYWSSDAMETTAYALALSISWAGFLRNNRSALPLTGLFVASLLRPEANALFLIALLSRVRGGRTPTALASTLGLAGLWTAYHLGRAMYFGGTAPTSFLVKVASSDGSIFLGLHALSIDVLCAAVPLAVTATVARSTPKNVILSLLPLAVHASMAVAVGGDWMGWSRLVLPGLAAFAMSAVSTSTGGSRSRPRPTYIAIALTLIGTTSVLAPNPGRAGHLTLRESPTLTPLTAGLWTPLSHDLMFIIEEAPQGAVVVMTDIGVPSQVDDVIILDSYGLAWRDVAEAAAGLNDGFGEQFLAMVADPQQRPTLLRSSRFDGVMPSELPEPIAPFFQRVAELRYDHGVALWFRGIDGRPSRELIAARWQSLVERFPSQPLMSEQLAIALADLGDMDNARSVAHSMASRFPNHPGLDTLPLLVDFPTYPRGVKPDLQRGMPMYWNSTTTTRPLDRDEIQAVRLHLDADSPGDEGALARVEVTGDCESVATESVVVFGPMLHALPVAPCSEGRHRVTVSFLNDRAEPDRNLYVRLAPDCGPVTDVTLPRTPDKARCL